MAKVLRIVTIAFITLIGVTVIAAVSSRASSNDYIEYWSAGKLFLQGANPYSSPMTLALEKSRGFTPNDPLIMLNPPWAMLLVAPLGLCPAFVGLVLWILLSAGCIVASIFLIEVPPKYRIIACLFAPVIASFSMEQVSPFLLLGFALFLRFHKSRPFAAGASLALMTLKPHLFLVFWTILLADCVYRRSVAIAAGLASALACASALVTLRVPHIWQDYVSLIRGSTLDRNYFPTLPTLFRMWIDVRLVWLALVPSCVTIVWGWIYYWRKRESWDWKRHGMLIMLVTILTSPYGWTSDEVVLLPAVASAGLSRRRFSMELLVCINFAALFLILVRSRLSIWLPAAWLAWYLYASWSESGRGAGGNDYTDVDQEAFADSSTGSGAGS
jgi:hypothetical protein